MHVRSREGFEIHSVNEYYSIGVSDVSHSRRASNWCVPLHNHLPASWFVIYIFLNL